MKVSMCIVHSTQPNNRANETEPTTMVPKNAQIVSLPRTHEFLRAFTATFRPSLVAQPQRPFFCLRRRPHMHLGDVKTHSECPLYIYMIHVMDVVSATLMLPNYGQKVKRSPLLPCDICWNKVSDTLPALACTKSVCDEVNSRRMLYSVFGHNGCVRTANSTIILQTANKYSDPLCAQMAS